jgi:hypothetical protein
MSILRSNNKLNIATQQSLAEYGIAREEAVKGSKKIKGSEPKYFIMEREGKDYNLSFPANLESLPTSKGQSLAIVAPDNEAFDLLAPKNFSEKLSFKDTKSIRKYLSRLLDTL